MEVQSFEGNIYKELSKNADLITFLSDKGANHYSIYFVLKSVCQFDNYIELLIKRMLSKGFDSAVVDFNSFNGEHFVSVSRISNDSIKAKLEKNTQDIFSAELALGIGIPTGWIKIQYNAKTKKVLRKILKEELYQIMDRFICDHR